MEKMMQYLHKQMTSLHLYRHLTQKMTVTNQEMEIITLNVDIDVENVIGLLGPISQANDATGSGTANIWQNNEIDGDDAADIPGINQVIVADDSCDEEGPGTNFAICDIEEGRYLECY